MPKQQTDKKVKRMIPADATGIRTVLSKVLHELENDNLKRLVIVFERKGENPDGGLMTSFWTGGALACAGLAALIQRDIVDDFNTISEASYDGLE